MAGVTECDKKGTSACQCVRGRGATKAAQIPTLQSHGPISSGVTETRNPRIVRDSHTCGFMDGQKPSHRCRGALFAKTPLKQDKRDDDPKRKIFHSTILVLGTKKKKWG